MSFFQIPDGLGNLGKSVSPVDHQREGAVLNELLQELQVLPADLLVICATYGWSYGDRKTRPWRPRTETQTA